ncbi:MAG: AAA-like domain-containing protein [Methanoregulaceae archaeon]|nr:AAA-like domain-containing protein [Methanoregulaceae archaeon]
MPLEQGNVWAVRMLGGFDVTSRLGEQPKFRSKSCRSLLAYLLLHPGKEVSRFFLEETFWPESDTNRQAQNLRRAIADLRDALDEGLDRGAIIATRRDVVACRPDTVDADTVRFLDLSERGLKSSDEDALLEAVAEYRGPLLNSIEDDWIYPYRLEFEERFGQCVERLCSLRIESGLAKEAVRVARGALLLAPNREDIHIALIRSYRQAGLETEALRQFEDLERIMDDTWGEPPSSAAREALEGAARSVRPPSRPVPVEPESAGGAMSATSPSYIRRIADDQAEACLSRGESVVLLQGPRQVGKSSLLARSLAYARENGCATVLNDFQTIGESQLADEERFYKGLAHSVASQLKVDVDLAALWSTWLGPNMNLDVVMGKLLEKTEGHVCWAIDEADRLFGRPYVNDFFGLLRSWHNRRALDPSGPWGKLTMALAYATEAHLFITDLNQSPFNVGVRLPLRDFSRTEVGELAARYGITTQEAIDAAYRTTHGHPFLTRRALAFLSQGGSAAELEATCTLPDGPFGDHLQGVLGVILQDAELVAEVKRMQAGEQFSKPTTRFRLMAAGILALSADARAEFRVPGYGPFLAAALG